MQKSKIGLTAIIMVCVIAVSACGMEKMSTRKTNDVDFTVVAESELPKEVSQIIEERKQGQFQVAYSDKENTYILIGYGTQKYDGYSIKVKSLYETKNNICVKTEFKGPDEYTSTETVTYPYIVIKIEYTDKNIVFSE